jgi:peptidoglycan hydrolase-like protein with peptidoglycan-binding domain
MRIDTLRGPGSVRSSAERVGAVATFKETAWPNRKSAMMMKAIVVLASAGLLSSCMVGPTLYRSPSTGLLVPCGGMRMPMDATPASPCAAGHLPIGWARQPVLASTVPRPPQAYAVFLAPPSRPSSIAPIPALPPSSTIGPVPVAVRPEPATFVPIPALPPSSMIGPVPVAVRPEPATFVPRTRELQSPPAEEPDGIRFVQTHMRLLGYSVPRDDGVLDEDTRTAIRAFQRRVGMMPDGRLSQRLHDQLQAEFNLCIVVRSMAAEPRSIDQHCGAALE